MANALIKSPPVVTVIAAVPASDGQTETYVDVSTGPEGNTATIVGGVDVPLGNPPISLGTMTVPWMFSHYTTNGVAITQWGETSLYFAYGPDVQQFSGVKVRSIFIPDPFPAPAPDPSPAPAPTPSGVIYRQHYLPTPPTEAVAEWSFWNRREGWEVNANSIKSLGTLRNTGGPYTPYIAKFKIPNGVIGVYCGMRFAGRADNVFNNQAAADTWVAFRKEGTVLSVSDYGYIVETNVAHNSASVLSITYDGVHTLWKVDDVLVHFGSAYDSVPPPVELAAMLYAPGDSVYDPSLELIVGGVGSCSFLPMSVVGGLARADGYAAFRPMTVRAIAGYINATFQPMSVRGGVLRAEGYASFRPMSVAAYTFAPAPVFSSGLAAFSPLRVSASANPHMRGGASFLPMAVRGSKPYADVQASFEAMSALGFGYIDSATQAAVNEWMTYADAETPVAIKPAIVSEALGLAIVFAPTSVRVANAQSVMTFTGTHALLSTMQGLAITVLDFGTPTPPYTDPDYVWVVNDDTGATSTYANFKFNSYAKLGERYYGMQSDGLYLLEGDDDAGTTTLANIGFGQQDFGTTAAKRVINVYVGVASTGALLLKISTNSVEAVYVQQRVSEDQRVARFVPGKGMQGTLLAFELYNEDNADFTLSSVEFHAIPLTRRI